MTTPQPIEEIMARALTKAFCFSDPGELFVDANWARYTGPTQAALQALQEAGYAVASAALIGALVEALSDIVAFDGNGSGGLHDYASDGGGDGSFQSVALTNALDQARTILAMLQHSPTQEGA